MSDLFDTPKHDDLIYDVGMHRGEDTEFYLAKGFRVVAFEANPELVSFCQERLKIFIQQGRLKIVEGAIVDADTIEAGLNKIQFYKNDNLSVWGTICFDWAERNWRFGTTSSIIEVDAVNFTNVIKEHGVPHYLKIDIEGADMVCLNELSNFQERPDYVSIKSNKISFANIIDELDTLIMLGYNCFQAIEQSSIHLAQTPPNPAREGLYAPHVFQQGSSGLFGSELNDEWKSKDKILRKYRAIHLGYYLLGDNGVLNQWMFPGSARLRVLVDRFCRLLTKDAVAGWYDTHARHHSVGSQSSVSSSQ